jgi:hypothetical protein
MTYDTDGRVAVQAPLGVQVCVRGDLLLEATPALTRVVALAA